MIGAVVGVQPFGGRGLSGTGPKAGGPLYLPRFGTEYVVSNNISAVGGYANRYSSPFASSDILCLHDHQTPSRDAYLAEPYRVSTFHFHDNWWLRALLYIGDASPTILEL